MILRSSGLALLVGVLALGACSDDEEGGLGEDEPCTSDSQCATGLTCDKHGKPEGTCQAPHHDSTSSSSAGASGGTGGSGASGAAGGAGGASSGGAGGSGGAEPTACETYCTCLQSTCSELEGYPHADEPACLSACNGLSEEELTCWTGFCFQAARATAAQDHLCEHAWGADGVAECR